MSGPLHCPYPYDLPLDTSPSYTLYQSYDIDDTSDDEARVEYPTYAYEARAHTGIFPLSSAHLVERHIPPLSSARLVE